MKPSERFPRLDVAAGTRRYVTSSEWDTVPTNRFLAIPECVCGNSRAVRVGKRYGCTRCGREPKAAA